MNEKQARKNVEPHGVIDSAEFEGRSALDVLEKACKWAAARGYLECFEQVKPLVEALRKMRTGQAHAPIGDEDCTMGDCDCDVRMAHNALNAWEKTQQ